MIKHSKDYVPKVGDRFKYPTNCYTETFTVEKVSKREDGYNIWVSPAHHGHMWNVMEHHNYEWYPKRKPTIIL